MRGNTSRTTLAIHAAATSALLTVVGLLGVHGGNSFISEEVECTIEAKRTATAKDNSTVLLVEAGACGLLEVRNDPLRGEFDAHTLYQKLEVGEDYRLRITGFSSPLLPPQRVSALLED